MGTIYYRPQRGRSTVIEGVYHNSHFVHAVTSHVGNVVQIQTQSGAIFEGIFRTFSPHFDVALEIVHRVEGSGSTEEDSSIALDSIYDVLIFKPSDIVYLKGKSHTVPYFVINSISTSEWAQLPLS